MKKTEALQLIAERNLDTYEKAHAFRVEIAVSKWGESERVASSKHYARPSLALMLNTIAVANPENIDLKLQEAAKALMSSDDRAWLRTGG